MANLDGAMRKSSKNVPPIQKYNLNNVWSYIDVAFTYFGKLFQPTKIASFMTGQIPNWWEWAYWVSPMTYGFNSLAVNEMYAPRWMNKLVCN